MEVVVVAVLDGPHRPLGAGRYLNAPGGRELYDPAVFAEAGLRLQPFDGATGSILQRLPDDPPERVRAELYVWQPDD